jgi:hypothetical protein
MNMTKLQLLGLLFGAAALWCVILPFLLLYILVVSGPTAVYRKIENEVDEFCYLPEAARIIYGRGVYVGIQELKRKAKIF